MQPRVAKKNLKRQAHPLASPDEQLAAALKSSRTILVSSLNQHHRGSNGNGVQAFTMAFCKAAQFPQHVLMTSITSKYFMSRGLEKPTIAQFADELASLAWALCYAAPEVVLKYILQLYCDEFDGHGYLRLEDCGLLLEDMHNIPNLDTDARGVATALIQEIADYAAAIQPATPVAVRSSPSASAARAAASTPEEISAITLDSEALSDIPELNVTVADMLSLDKKLLESSIIEDEDDRTTVGSYCTSDMGEESALHIDTVVRFFKLRRSKLWSLVSFQAQLRSVFFGDKYWKQLTTSSRQPTSVAEAAYIFTLTAALRRMYMPDEPAIAAAQTTPVAPAAATKETRKGLRGMWQKRSEQRKTQAVPAVPKLTRVLSFLGAQRA